MNIEIEKIKEIKQLVKGRANEISQHLSKDDIDKIHAILEMIDDLEYELADFEEIINEVWEGTEVF